MGRWVAALVLGLALAADVSGEEVVETFEDGRPRLRYGVDAEGRKHGPYVEHFPDGKTALRCGYRQDKLDGLWTAWFPQGKMRAKGSYRLGARQGRWEEWKEDGSLWRVSAWRDGLRDGPTQVFAGKELVADQVWAAGRLLRLDGAVAFPRTVEALEAVLATLHPEPPAPGASYDLGADRARALRLLKAYRYLCEVPHEDVVIDLEVQALAQEASRICAALGDITHEPPNVGWPEAEYRRAAQGAKGSNLHQGVGAFESVHGYMDDSDPTNVDRVGHRCWCLSPNLVKTGFGVTHDKEGKEFTAMWATDDSRAPPREPELVAYPPRGWSPIDMFGPRHAWSVALGLKQHPALDPAQVTIEVQPLDAEALPLGAPLALEEVRVGEQAPGMGRRVIFRPKDFTLRDGATFRVTLSGLGPPARRGQAPKRLRYVVGFYASPRSAPR
jgi:hypothetical protein